ncbi:precorrin-8X methylmutase [Methermicoccus shengliensis]|uniref:Precorrin-8X methylmutase n=1 Tax=Methermicoccus shengliensis TaxID=660064 RepID=A0A832RW86_9EURY|nr:precorrin-8X methylmutase [Methermicoccus shengliensis]KUK04900.1 MAG: Precorrin-8X methylmutase CbiC/CobH [Euryarchaeota archaeon 55_53]KUK30428.1 MAG: Precorrin-8X methylmutase CbiC/CobH [Methanosarcinales archeaon 56_1174]MDI3488313.1 precorrin-8X/cobalt-precorrin-8 methylmutase [Methanosarcinales archaeon]MDN5295318.1 precorrin-8X/cobalt-precorrin-8 methylmutase [Methanosarcinales archaeon]HIH69594.1 precorrin-8X methylmutase [Methermicoccus shengliensis]
MRIDMGDVTEEASQIKHRSYQIVERYVSGDSPEDFILKRCIIATGDPQMRELIAFRGNAVEAGIEAVRKKSKIITDVRMVKVGINTDAEVLSAVEHCDGAREAGITRTSMGMLNLREELNGAMVAIGNAPSAALTLCRLVEEGVSPAVIVATPVGFVNAAESKEMIRELAIPSITSIGTRGGSTLCVAIVNGLINLAKA